MVSSCVLLHYVILVVGVNTFQAGAVQRTFQAANEQFKLLVVRYSSKVQPRGRMIAEVWLQ